MRAGFATRPAITRPSSSPESRSRRSTMRYCTGFESGMRSLRKQRFDQLVRLPLGPVALPVDPVAHLPLRVHEEGHRQALHVPARRGAVGRTDPYGKVEFRAREVARDRGLGLAVVHRDEFEGPARELLPELHERGQLFLARAAPRGPEIHEHHAALEIAQAHAAAIERVGRERRRGLRAPGADRILVRERGRRRREDEGRGGESCVDQASSFELIVYLKLSESSESRRVPAVSHCGYMRNGTLPWVAPGSTTSLPVLYASQFISHDPKRRFLAARTFGSSGALPPSSSRI